MTRVQFKERHPAPFRILLASIEAVRRHTWADCFLALRLRREGGNSTARWTTAFGELGASAAVGGAT